VDASDAAGVRIRLSRELERSYRGRLIFSLSNADRSRAGEGTVSVHPAGSGPCLKIINEIAARDYLASVVGSEAPPRCPAEALKAISVLAVMLAERTAEAEVIGDSTREQAYKGAQHATPAVHAALRSVIGSRLYFKGAQVSPFYHSTCAGGTSSASDIFGEAARGLKYLVPVKCSYCLSSPFFKTKKVTVPTCAIEKIFDGSLPEILRYDSQRRPVELRISGSTGVDTISGYQAWLRIGRNLGWGKMPGTRYHFSRLTVDGRDCLALTSRGAGHGVGLCQWGAYGLAMRGKNFKQILRFYFPGSRVNLVSRHRK
jgi:stage II sporulation protein D